MTVFPILSAYLDMLVQPASEVTSGHAFRTQTAGGPVNGVPLPDGTTPKPGAAPVFGILSRMALRRLSSHAQAAPAISRLTATVSGDIVCNLSSDTGMSRLLSACVRPTGTVLTINSSSRELLRIARGLRSHGLTDVVLVRGAPHSLPLRDGCCSAVTCHVLLYATAAPEGIVREAARVLRPGGRLVVDLMNPDAATARWFARGGLARVTLERLQSWTEPESVELDGRVECGPVTVYVFRKT